MNRQKLKYLIAVSLFYLLFFSISPKVQAQEDSSGTLRIAILAPLYLDSAFESFNYKLGNTNIPKLFMPGLDFYNGAVMAIDSLNNEGRSLDVWFYDTKKKGFSPEALAEEMSIRNFSLIIAAFSNTAEQKVLSAFSFSKNIPLVSATYPNDAYVNGNPFFLMVNSSLKTHVEAIYKYMQRNYPVAKFIYVTRNGSLEDKIQNMFDATAKKTYQLNYKTVQLKDLLSTEQLIPLLDSNKQNVVICGSLDENFGANLVKALDQLPASYQVVAAGMPTWDGLKPLLNTTNENLDIVYSTPYNYQRTDKTISAIISAYKSKFYARPSDMVFKGYETTYYFSSLLLNHKNELLNNLSDETHKISGNFDFEPVRLSDTAQIPDYLENRKLFFIHLSLGKISYIN